MMIYRACALVVAVSLGLLACSGSSGTTINPPPSPPPASSEHLYVGEDDLPGAIQVYDLPLSSTSMPIATVPHDANISLSVDSTTLAATRLTDYSISFFAVPVTSASVPYATLGLGSSGDLLFLPSGALYVGTGDSINVYTPPFTSTSTPSGRIAPAGYGGSRMAIDPAGNVYVLLSSANKLGVIRNGGVTTTVAYQAGLEFRALAASATQLFVCEGTGSAPQVYIYALPLTASSTPTLIMNPNTDSPNDCALDGDGNLYIASGNTVAVFNPPFTTTGHAALVLDVTGADALTIGP